MAFFGLFASSTKVQTSSNTKQAHSFAASYALATQYEYEEKVDTQKSVYGYDRNVTSASSNPTDIAPGSTGSQVYAVNLVNSIFSNAAGADGKLTYDEIEAYKGGSLSSAERAAANFLSSHYTSFSGSDGDSSNITLGDLSGTEDNPDTNGDGKGDIQRLNPFVMQQIADKEGISVEELEARLANGEEEESELV